MIDTIMAFITQYGYIAIFFLFALGIVGLPMPEETLLTFSGFLVSLGKLNYLLTILAAFLGSALGMSLSYFIGAYLGLPFLEKYGRKIFISPERLKKVDVWFQKYGKFTVSFGYFVPGIRHMTAYFSGISKWGYLSFALFALPGGLIWTITFVTLGRFLGANWHVVLDLIHRYMMTTVGVIALLVALGFGIGYVYKKYRIEKVK